MGDDSWAELADKFADDVYASVKGSVRTSVMHQQLLEHLPEPPAPVLDVGGGAGHQSFPLAHAGYEVTLLDPSPAMLDKARQRLERLPDEARRRVRLIQGDGEHAFEAVDGRRFAAVLCHGVLGYLEQPDPLVDQLCRCAAADGVVSIMTGNAKTSAVRPALERRWDDALAAFDATTEVGVLGVQSRADTVEGLSELMQRQGVVPLRWYGVWLFVDWLEFSGVELDPRQSEQVAAITAVELEASRRDPYRQLSRVFHLLGTQELCLTWQCPSVALGEVPRLCNGGPVTSVVVSSEGAGYGLLVDDRALLHQAGFGPDIDAHMQRLPAGIPPGLYPLAYPAYDEEPTRAPSLRVTHGDGTTTTRLEVEDIRVVGRATDILLVDPDCALEVRLCFRAEDHGVLRQWVSVTNRQPKAVTLYEVAAASPLLAARSPHLTHFGGGDWSAEWTTTTEVLTPGTKVVDSRGGVQPHLRSCPFFLLTPDGPPDESSGTALAGSLAWGGNTRFAFERSTTPTVRAWCGHNPAGSEYVLDPGACLVTPEQIWAWSTGGVGPLSRRLHRWVRDNATRDGGALRPIVVNNWEATSFSFGTERLLGLIDHTADLGAELFLLDDGWFGVSHPRDDDTVGLGDWEVDNVKLPGGLGPLIARADERGIGFGLWVEPEMVNPGSTLYTEHPDWVVGQPTRRPRRWRSQFVLDILQPDVAEFVCGVFDRILAEHPGITYLKWDANRPLTDPGSPTLGADRQANFWFDHARATWQLMETVAERHPDQTLMLCASGGGRVDLGSLRWFHEVWLSDNTDPVHRLHMQWAASHFLPSAVVAAHVTREGDRPIPFACAVAMSARFGFDLDLAGISDDERAVCRRAVTLYREIRSLVQQGDLWRLEPPGERAALSYVSADRQRAVIFAYQLARRTKEREWLRPSGLDPSLTYGIAAFDLSTDADATSDGVDRRNGAALMEDGLAWPLWEPYTARIFVLQSE